MSTDSRDGNSADVNKDESASKDVQAKRQALARALARLLHYRRRQDDQFLAGRLDRGPSDRALPEDA